MAEGDLLYDDDQGWLIEGDGLLSESADPFDQALWAILRQVRITPEMTNADLQAILDSALIGAEAAIGGDGQTPVEWWQDPRLGVKTWPIMSLPQPGVFYGIGKTPAFVPEPDWGRMAQVVNLAQDLRIPGTPGLPEEEEDVELPPLKFENKADADAEAARSGGVVVRRSDGWWGVEDAPPEGGRQPAAIVRGEDVGGASGTWFIRQPNGTLTPYTPPAGPSEPSFNEEFDRLLLAGRYDEATQLWDIREEITSRGGRMTRAEAAQYLTDDLFKAEEIPALLDALTGPRRATEGPLGQPLAPEGQARPPTTPEQIIEAGQGKQWFDAQGNPIPTPLWAAAQSIQAAARPFPTLPFGALPGAQEAIDRNRQQIAQAQARAAQGPFGMAAEEQAATGFQGAFQAAAPPSLAAPTQAFPTTVEEFDPNFATATPEVQEAIRQEFARQQAARAAPAAPAPSTPPVDTSLRNVFAGQTPNVEAARQRVAAQAQPSPQVFEPPFDISGLSPETQAAIRAGKASVFQSGPDIGGPGAGMQQSFQVQEVNGERKGVHQVFSRQDLTPQQQVPKPLSFADAIAQINERRLHRRLLSKPQGRTVFA